MYKKINELIYDLKKQEEKILIDELRNLLSLNCQPIKLEGDAIPSTFIRLVAQKKCHV